MVDPAEYAQDVEVVAQHAVAQQASKRQKVAPIGAPAAPIGAPSGGRGRRGGSSGSGLGGAASGGGGLGGAASSSGSLSNAPTGIAVALADNSMITIPRSTMAMIVDGVERASKAALGAVQISNQARNAFEEEHKRLAEMATELRELCNRGRIV